MDDVEALAELDADWRVEHIDERNDADGKHQECWLVVLDPHHDRVAFMALMRYADLCFKHGKYALGEAMLAKLEEVNARYEYRS